MSDNRHLFLDENQFISDWLMICYCAKLWLSDIKGTETELIYSICSN